MRRGIHLPRSVSALVAAALVAGSLAACGSSTIGGSGQTTTSNPAAAANALLQRGIAEAEAKKFSQAITTFGNVLLIDPRNTYALYNLGVIDQERHDPHGALARYDEALKSDTTYTPAMYNKALILEATNPGAALSLYRQIVTINPKASTAYLRMAIVYAKRGDSAQATAARAKAVAIDPTLASYRLPATCTKKPRC